MKLEFRHRQSAHCESGVTANLLRNAGFEITEAMVFGLGAGINYAYLPMVRVNRLPLIAYRSMPGAIFKRVTRSLKVTTSMTKFKDPASAREALDLQLERGVPVGLQVGIYWLPFMPPALRFHFNSHNMVVYGKEDDEYLVSDPTMEGPATIASVDLDRARFAEGPLAPRGKMYTLTSVPKNPDLPPLLRKSIKSVCNAMLRAPLPFVGVKGIRFFARRMANWPKKLGEKHASYHLGHTIRMQEEIGTGGGGFRFVYAAFLQEAAPLMGIAELSEVSRLMTEAGDSWRNFAATSARVCKGRSDLERPYEELKSMLMEIADQEEAAFRRLLKCV